jgi:hypothetical protein
MLKKTTVAEYGKVLPEAGVPFSFVPLTGRREKEIWALINSDETRASSLPWQVRCTLAVLLDSVGSLSFPAHENPLTPNVKELEKRADSLDSLHLSLGDAYYLYLWAKIEGISSDMNISRKCLMCNTSNEHIIDLRELEVSVYDEVPEKQEVDLDPPVRIGATEYTKAKVGGLKFSAPKAMLDSYADAKIEAVCEVTTLVDYDFPLAPEIVSNWPSRVIKTIYQVANDRTAGITQTLEFRCANCGRVSPYPISWEFLTFFG